MGDDWHYKLINVSVPLPQKTKDYIDEHIPKGRRTYFMRKAILRAVKELKKNG